MLSVLAKHRQPGGDGRPFRKVCGVSEVQAISSSVGLFFEAWLELRMELGCLRS